MPSAALADWLLSCLLFVLALCHLALLILFKQEADY